MRLTRNQLLEQRIREIRRKILHTHSEGTRNIYNDHIEFLQSTIK